MFYHVLFAADHHAIAAFETPDSAARAHVNVVDFFRGEFFGATNVVDIIRISAIYQDVVGFQGRQEVMDGLIHHSRRDHQPYGAGLLQLLQEILQRGRADSLVLLQFADGF